MPRQTFQAFYEHAVKERDEPRIHDHCNNIVKFLNDAKTILDIDKRYAFETGIIHGDWHSGNLLFTGETLKGIIDMEFAGGGCYLEDISYAVSNLCISPPERGQTAVPNESAPQLTSNIARFYAERWRCTMPWA